MTPPAPHRLVPEVAIAATALVGEGPVWDDAREELVWVDLAAGLLHRSDPATGETRTAQTGALLGAVALRARDDGYAAAVQDGFALLTPDGEATLAHGVTASEDRRMNDAKCDPAGRLWGGGTAMATTPGDGSLLVWDADGARTTWTGLTLPNGLGWSPDGATFYLADSLAGVVHRAAFDVDAGALGEPEAWLTVDLDRDGLPDGLCLDADGCLWIAYWGGRAVRRHAPDDGRVLATIDMPVTQPSSCALAPGGTLYVTSARAGLDEATLAAEPHAGSVFAVDVGVEPVPVAPFAG